MIQVIINKKVSRINPVEKELQRLEKQEQAFLNKHSDKSNSKINQLIEDKVPDKLQETLEKSFAKAFNLIFEKGTGIIEKT